MNVNVALLKNTNCLHCFVSNHNFYQKLIRNYGMKINKNILQMIRTLNCDRLLFLDIHSINLLATVIWR